MPETVLRPASESPWYVLATVAGELDPALPNLRTILERNRRLWNAWMLRNRDAERVAYLAEQLGVDPSTLGPPTTEEVEQIVAAFAARLPDGLPPNPHAGRVNISNLVFSRPLWLSGFVFPDPIDADGCVFESTFHAESSVFVKGASFERAVFKADVHFTASDLGTGLGCNGADFARELSMFKVVGAGVWLTQARVKGLVNLESSRLGGLHAAGCRFEAMIEAQGLELFSPLDGLDLEAARVTGYACFDGAKVAGPVNFEKTRFDGALSLCDGHFGADVNMAGATLAMPVRFRGSRFVGAANFAGLVFPANADFSATTFDGTADFDGVTFAAGSDFSDGAFHGPTRFQRARFQSQPPRFFGRDLHANTGFSLVQRDWPRITAATAAEAKPAFTRLRHAVQDLQMADEEHFFFRQEMRCKQVLDGWPDRWLIRAYGLLSDYGNSVTRPLAAMGVVVALGWLAVWLGIGAGWDQALGISILSALPFLGLLPVIQPGFHDAAPPWLDALSVGQGVAGFALLFFLGLGLRNRFRLK